jgi:NAD(P)-dependent dehydrogenase (short-subunit alcohol dehydrogenase family)
LTLRRNRFDLTGKVALVTGGNSGLGLGFATGIAEAGGDVVIWGRRADRNRNAAAMLREYGVHVLTQAIDVTDEAQVVAGIPAAVTEMGRLDCVVANAGMIRRVPSFLELSTDVWEEVLAVNLHGVFFTMREAARHMVERSDAGDPGGSLILNGSLATIRGVKAIQHYAAAKGALASMMRGLAVELGGHGIRANLIMPGKFPGLLDPDRPVPPPPKLMPIQRYGVPEDVAGIVVYLMSDASRYHTGDMITIDGGASVFV